MRSIFPKSVETAPKQKGVYTMDRDICLCYRYYYHYEILRSRPDDVLVALESEFFVSSSTLMTQLTKNADLLKDIVINKPTRNQLRKKYPHFVWN